MQTYELFDLRQTLQNYGHYWHPLETSKIKPTLHVVLTQTP